MLENTKTMSFDKKWVAFLGITLLSFGCYLDYTVVNVALPTIQQELKANLISLQWVMNIYFMVLCILATLMGKLADMFGRRRCLYIGGLIFTFSSLLSGLSSTIDMLIIGRLLQGVGAAMVFPISISLVPQMFPVNQQEKAIAWFGCLGGMSLALGPLLGGFIVAYAGWRWIFYINVPLSIVGYILCLNSVDESEKGAGMSLDFGGMLFLALTIAFFILGLINSQQSGWATPMTLIFLGSGLLSGLILYHVEKKQANPIIHFPDYKNPLFLSGAVLCFLAGALSSVTLFFDPLFLQIIKKQSPQYSGLVLFSIPVAVFVVAFIVGRFVAIMGIINTILLGLFLAAIATFSQLFFNGSTSLFYILVSFICLGSMWAMGNTVSIIAVQNAVAFDRRSTATGSLVTLFNIGGSIGLSIAIVAYNLFSYRSLSLQKASLNSGDYILIKKLLINPAKSLQITLNEAVEAIFNNLFIQGFVGVMLFLFIISLLGFIGVFLIKTKQAQQEGDLAGHVMHNPR